MATAYLLVRERDGRKQVLGVFSSYGDANDVWSTAGDARVNDELSIDFFHIDSMVGWEFGATWKAFVCKSDGGVRRVGHVENELRHPTLVRIEQDGDWFVAYSPISHEHAIEVATDKRDEMTMTQM
jgi:hypothetical protein